MATSPLFGWQEPDDTSLVKDGAAAIRTLGNAIDTSMGDLLGGTTGQVLAKASNTNMDFTWVAQDDSNAIQNAIVDAKGDLIAASANDTPARLAVGANGETLVADSSTSTGLRWQGTIAAGRNFAINGGFDIWQRGTSFSGSNAYNADRWFVTPSNATVSRQSSGAPIGSQYYARTTATGSSAYANQFMFFETSQIAPLQGRTVTISTKVRRNATMNVNLAITVEKSVTVDAGIGATWLTITPTSGSASVSNANITTGTTSADWTTISAQYLIPNDGTANGLKIVVGESAAMPNGSIWDHAQLQVEIGSVATQFSRAGGTIQGELAACQRYLPSVQVSSSDIAIGQAYATTASLISIPFPVTARVAPTGVTVNAAGNFRLRNATSSLLTCTSLLFSTASTQSASLDGNVASGLVAGNATNLYNAGSGTILFTGCEL